MKAMIQHLWGLIKGFMTNWEPFITNGELAIQWNRWNSVGTREAVPYGLGTYPYPSTLLCKATVPRSLQLSRSFHLPQLSGGWGATLSGFGCLGKYHFPQLQAKKGPILSTSAQLLLYREDQTRWLGKTTVPYPLETPIPRGLSQWAWWSVAVPFLPAF
jgi:hypothetical protein